MDLSRTLRTLVISGGSTAVVVVVGAAVATLYTARTTSERSLARQRAALAEHHREFLEDQGLAATLPIFARRPGARDAGPVLGPRVGWTASDPEALRRYREALPADLRGLAPDPALLAKLGQRWLDADPALGADLDFGWMSRLADLDFWDLDRNSPEPPSPAFRSTPGGAEISIWAQLRLLKALHDGAPAAGIREVEELARLCATAEDTSTIATGLGLLGLADEARRRAASLGGATGGPEPRQDADALRRANRALWGARAHAELRTPATYDADWDRIAIGRCAALGNGLAAAALVRPVLLSSHRAEYDRLSKLLALSPECRLERLRQVWSQSDPADAGAPRDGRSWPVRFVRWLPGTRKLFGEMTVAVNEHDWFEQYGAPRPQ